MTDKFATLLASAELEETKTAPKWTEEVPESVIKAIEAVLESGQRAKVPCTNRKDYEELHSVFVAGLAGLKPDLRIYSKPRYPIDPKTKKQDRTQPMTHYTFGIGDKRTYTSKDDGSEPAESE